MLRKFLPVLLAMIGLGAGLGAGLALRPEPKTPETESGEDRMEGTATGHEAGDSNVRTDDGAVAEYVKLSNQFVIPVIEKGRVASMVVLSLSLEILPGQAESIHLREPKLRDAFLQVMFDHANVGGFSGSFTDGSNLVVLRENLGEAAAMVLGPIVRSVLITDIARQDT